MIRLKKIFRDQIVELVFIMYSNKINLRECLVALVCVVNFCDFNAYISVLMLICSIVYIQNVNTYIAHRFISFTIVFSTICIKLFTLYPMLLMLLCIIAHDTYYNVLRPSTTASKSHDYNVIEQLLMIEHNKYINNICEYDEYYDNGIII